MQAIQIFSAVSEYFYIINNDIQTNVSQPANFTKSTQEVVVQPCIINDAKWSSICTGDWTFSHSGVKRIEMQVNRCTSPEKVSMFVTYVWMDQYQSVTISASLIDSEYLVSNNGDAGISLLLSKVSVHDTYIVFEILIKVNTLTNGVSLLHVGKLNFGSPDYSVCQLPFTTLCQAELDRCKPSLWYTSAVISAALFVLFVIISTSVAVAVICCCCDNKRKYAKFDELTRKKVKKILKAKEFAKKRSPSIDALMMLEQKEKEKESLV